MHITYFSETDIIELNQIGKSLENICGVNSFRVSNGPDGGNIYDPGAYVHIATRIELVEQVWDVMNIPRDSKTPYNEIIQYPDNLQLYFTLIKLSEPLHNVYYADAHVFFGNMDVKNWKMYFGSIASKDIEGLIERIRYLLLGKEKFFSSTEKALEAFNVKL